MDRRGLLQVSPDALQREAGVMMAIPHPDGYGASWSVLALGEAVAGAEPACAGERFARRAVAAFGDLDERRAALTRALARAAAAYDAQETRVERGMRSRS